MRGTGDLAEDRRFWGGHGFWRGDRRLGRGQTVLRRTDGFWRGTDGFGRGQTGRTDGFWMTVFVGRTDDLGDEDRRFLRGEANDFWGGQTVFGGGQMI